MAKQKRVAVGQVAPVGDDILSAHDLTEQSTKGGTIPQFRPEQRGSSVVLCRQYDAHGIGKAADGNLRSGEHAELQHVGTDHVGTANERHPELLPLPEPFQGRKRIPVGKQLGYPREIGVFVLHAYHQRLRETRFDLPARLCVAHLKLPRYS